MRIIIYTSARDRSGGTRQALYLAQGLEGRGHNVSLFTDAASTLRDLAPDWPHWGDLGPRSHWRAAIEAAMPADGSPCVVHAFHNAAVKRAAWWGLSWKKRAVVVAHRGVIYRPRNPLPYWSPGVDGFLVNSGVCAGIIRSMGVSRKRIFLVANNIPEERLARTRSCEETRAALGIDARAFVFGTVANRKPVKGVDVLVRAFARVCREAAEQDASAAAGLHLLAVGLKGEEWDALARECGVAGRVTFTGPREDVADLLGAMDCFILPSRSESMPNTLLEAVCAGLPCIGTRVGAVPEILERCGLTVPPGNVPAMARAMTALREDSDARRRFAAESRKQAGLYATERRLDTVEGIYRGLMRKKGFSVPV